MLAKKESTLNNHGNNDGLQIGVNKGPINIQTKAKTISILSQVIKNISKNIAVNEETDLKNKNLIPFKIEEKIKHNIILKYKRKFEKYKMYYSICDQVLNRFDDNLTNNKEKLLNNINDMYNDVIGEFIYEKQCREEIYDDIDNIDLIKEEKLADKIIDLVMNKLRKRLGDDILEEDKDFGLNIIMCYAFVKCKILEKPECEV
ncbi:hypothetical protein H5J22_02435 [Cetobacterium sp. 8H]|uniref:hypothetical protein n=1 Tax=Cetobacterium sp. 8H TaxID=2759681 RepID=UPI00163BF0BB|nr:hypothetical protein [Cetobacterium sp. 8H]MBC2850300.1 hypothetical protein [Cetobacterium sp. 8H]